MKILTNEQINNIYTKLKLKAPSYLLAIDKALLQAQLDALHKAFTQGEK